MLRDIRNNYKKYELLEDKLVDDPQSLFENWMNEALEQKVIEPTVMVLSTVENGQADSRVVLLKELIPEGFVFYTNFLSTKGQQINQNPKVSLNFFWAELERQVRIKGEASRLNREVAQSYFDSRPRDSQLGACASMQSSEIENRNALEAKFIDHEKKYEGKPIPMPEYWGGYLVKPTEIEFWQGRSGRLHDRICYFQENESWKYKRLQP